MKTSRYTISVILVVYFNEKNYIKYSEPDSISIFEMSRQSL
jgi:hypothetical protein